MRSRRSPLVVALAVAGLLLAGCGGDDGDDVSSDDAPTTSAAPSTTEGDSSSTTSATTSDSTETTASTTTDTTTPDDGSDPEDPSTELSPGDPCPLEEGIPDCIDPDGDGEGTYLLGGDDCVATAVDISICEDLDGDGTAGFPDEYDDLPTCGPDQPPPCNNPDDPDAEDQG